MTTRSKRNALALLGNATIALLSAVILVSIAIDARDRNDESTHSRVPWPYLAYGGHSFDQTTRALPDKARATTVSLITFSRKTGSRKAGELHQLPSVSGRQPKHGAVS
jgi:hypothetical protein